jgi:hypothetical protein
MKSVFFFKKRAQEVSLLPVNGHNTGHTNETTFQPLISSSMFHFINTM